MQTTRIAASNRILWLLTGLSFALTAGVVLIG